MYRFSNETHQVQDPEGSTQGIRTRGKDVPQETRWKSTGKTPKSRTPEGWKAPVQVRTIERL
jgi:hypothetical protein